MPYTFQTNLLSAEKMGVPFMTGTALSSNAVTFLSGNNVAFATQTLGIVSLSSSDAGITFTPVQITVAPGDLATFNIANYPIVTVNVLGSIFNIPSALNGSNLAIVKSDPNRVYTMFSWLSGTTTVLSNALTTVKDVSTANSRRLRLYGYM